jgi:hypothetical protein
MDDRWLPSGTTRLPTDEWPQDGILLYQVAVAGWRTENDPELALERRLEEVRWRKWLEENPIEPLT